MKHLPLAGLLVAAPLIAGCDKPAILPIDAAAPAKTATATFALG